MVLSTRAHGVAVRAAIWAGRSTAILFFLLWGAFFVEHLSEWFLRSDGRYPPAWVWAQQFFHLGMLVGLAMILKWERLGSLVLVLSTAAFIAGLGLRGFPAVLLLNLVPAVFCATAWWLRRRAPAGG